MKPILLTCFFSGMLASYLPATAWAQQHDHSHDVNESIGVHQHGKATLTLVLEGNEMQLAFESAAHSIVGFEHKPHTNEQLQEVTAAIEVFNDARWFNVNPEANCEVTVADASTDLNELHASAGHADFYANYQLLCQQPARLSEITLDIFNLLPALETVTVQWIINGRQGAADARLGEHQIRF